MGEEEAEGGGGVVGGGEGDGAYTYRLCDVDRR